ncbi:hypothetical protein GCM10012275_50930 [Longimycelium tulufanense]|uniref:Cupin type-2 domain-containing protein n=1 Tax=Longimycelium tulufanense TaxID=907463 RepID=A0A8J3FXG5_9PSEU|nr:cupin domain-containing protein [Longimycelium tulufanense]GGM74025.1 hypothetical protein GCM10012275_50930 [Longimycelium tulufanense]
MRTRHSTLVVTLASVAALTAGAASTQAYAGPSNDRPAPAVREVAQGRQDAPVSVDVAGPVQVNFREIVLPPGSGTGKHCHYGQLIAVVKQGTFTHYAPIYPGGVHRYVAGDSVVEGSGYVHEGRNEGKQAVVLWVTYVTPEGKPLAETDLTKCSSQGGG